MLRVSSILYLQKIWTSPVAKPSVIIRAPSPTHSSVSVEQIIIDSHSVGPEEITEQSTCYGTVDIVSNQEEEEEFQLKIKEEFLIKEKKREQERKRIEEEEWQIELERQKNEKRLKELLQKQKEKQRLQEKQIDEELYQEECKRNKQEKKRQEEENYSTPSTPSTPTPSTTMGDLSCSNSSSIHDKQAGSIPYETSIHPYSPAISTRDRDYYDDELSSDNEQIIDQLPTPPSTPNKFSPKRILHRAKSSIHDESVRNLGRRTSQFLEKKLLHPTSTSSDEFSIKGLRRQSSKLSVKGKTLGKKLKRVLSFHQSS